MCELLMTLAPSANHQRRDRALAVALVARGEIFIHAVGGAARGTLVQFRVEIKFEIRFGKNIRADVAAFHHQIAELQALALAFDHPLAHFRHGGDVRDRGAGFRRADFLFGIIAVHEQMHRAQPFSSTHSSFVFHLRQAAATALASWTSTRFCRQCHASVRYIAPVST